MVSWTSCRSARSAAGAWSATRLRFEQDGGERLADLVVEFLGDAVAFGFLGGQRARCRGRSASRRSSIVLNVVIRSADRRCRCQPVAATQQVHRPHQRQPSRGPARSQQRALAPSITANPMTRTGTSVSMTGAETVAGDSEDRCRA